jgi:hypothetical protein
MSYHPTLIDIKPTKIAFEDTIENRFRYINYENDMITTIGNIYKQNKP